MPLPPSSKKLLFLLSLVLMVLLAACTTTSQAAQPTQPELAATPASTTTQVPVQPSPTLPPATSTPELSATPTIPPTVTDTPTHTPTATPDTRLDPVRWREWPSIPTVSGRAHEVYQQGLALGNDPHAFSRVGDCESAPEAFLGFYVEEWAWLPADYQYLQAAIDHFNASFGRDNITARDGFGVSSVLSPLMADPTVCNNNETPLECEYRLHKPSLIFISMGTNWAPYAGDSYEKYLRQIIEFSIENGILPILMTKADNLELDHSINAATARLAYEYDLPLFNFWRVAQALPQHGLEDDGAHLTTQAEDSRNFHGLLTLYSVWDQLLNWGKN